MAAHEFGSATTADLWTALEAASGKPVAAIAKTYTEQPGVPLVIADARCTGGKQEILLRQRRFTIHDPTTYSERWQIPVALGFAGSDRPSQVMLFQDEPAAIVAEPCGKPVTLNFAGVGYYRVQYDAATQRALASAMESLGPADRVELLADSWALAASR